MKYLPAVLIVSFFFTWVTTRIFLKSKIAMRLLDMPNERSLHSTPIPRAGGVLIMISLLLGWLCFGGHGSVCSPILFIALALAVFSLIDDKKGLPILLRLFVHLLAASVLLVFVDTGSDLTTVASILLLGLLILGTAWMMNLFNFMDGADGLAGGMAFFGFAALGLFAWFGNNLELAVFCALIAGAAAGFLVFNRPPAQIFMGDSGSIPLGFLAAAVSLAGWHMQLWPLLAPMIVFSPFWIDATITLLRRAVRKEKVWQAHREHYYQRMILLGLGHRRTMLVYYAAMLFCASIAGFVVVYPEMPSYGLIALSGGLALIYLTLGTIIDLHWRRLSIAKAAATVPGNPS